MLTVTSVKKNSSAYRAGIRKGDTLLRVNGYPAVDELDFLFGEGEEMSAEVAGKGEVRFFAEGLEVRANGKIRTCQNNCVFCFVDQMPKGMRESLYVKDDDYSMSFECGNFVTLTNLKEEDIARIIRLNLSPLYVSVQTMNPELRCELLRNRFAGKIVTQIDRLAKAGIEIHCQSVIVPNKNDGEDLKQTARKLFAYYPAVQDLAVVPTGLTKFREGLTEIPDVDGEYSAKFLDTVEELNGEFGVNFVLPADEYFIKANRPFYPVEFYGDFAQIENGIGITSKFLGEFADALAKTKRKKPARIVCVCGTSAEKVMKGVCDRANGEIENLQARALAVKNDFFGESVTCTGLLTGQDIAKALGAVRDTFDEVVLSCDCFKSFEEVFLDGMTLKQLRKTINCTKIHVNHGGGGGLYRILAGMKK